MHEINPAYKAYWRSAARYNALYGGAGSSKSVTVAQRQISRAAGSDRVRVLVLRKTARTCRHSTFALLKDVLKSLGRLSEARVNKNEMTIGFPGGGDILHAGLDDPQKLKSISGVTHIWIEEATQLDFPADESEEDDLAQIDLRLRGVDAELNPSITLTFNPTQRARAIFDYLGVAESDLPERDWMRQGDVFVQHTTHEDNPWVGDEYLSVFRRLGGTMQTVYEGGQLARVDDPQQVIPYALVKQAKETEPEAGQGYMAVDVARYGADKTVLAHKEGTSTYRLERHEQKSTTETADIAAQRIHERSLSAEHVGIDAIGVGAGVVDTLRDRGLPVVSIVSGEKPARYRDGRETELQFRNLRSQMWWLMREQLRQGTLALPGASKKLEEDLCAPRYRIAAQKTVEVEAKEKTKQRLGRSPDDGDAAVYVEALTELMLGEKEDLPAEPTSRVFRR